MMKKGLLLLVAISSLLVFTACSEREKAINAVARLSVFVDDVSKNYSQYTDEDWKEKDAEYDALIKEIDRHRYPTEMVHEIGRLKGKYSGIKTKSRGIRIIKKIGDTYENIKGQYDGFKEGILNDGDSTEN